MKRYALLPMDVDEDGTRAPTVPAAATSWVLLHEFGQRGLVKLTLPDGTPKTANTIADITLEPVWDDEGTPTGRWRQVDVNADPLTPAQQAAAKSFLENNGVDTSDFDADTIDTRPKLLRFLLKREAHFQNLTIRQLLDGWDSA